MIKAAIFDFDGVIVRSQEHLHAYLSMAAEKQGKKFPSLEELPSIWANHDAIESYVGPTCDKENPNFWLQYNASKLNSFIPLEPGIDQVLHKLSQLFPLAICSTSMTHVIEKHLNTHAIRQYFSIIIGKNSVPVAEGKPLIKPSPHGLLMILDQLGLKPEETIFIGDEITDYIAANRVAEHRGNTIPTIGIPYGLGIPETIRNYGFTYIAERPQEIVDIVLSQNSGHSRTSLRHLGCKS